jgi:hypothetical protein
MGRSSSIAGGAIALAPANETARISELQAETRRQIQNLSPKDRRSTDSIDTQLPVLDVPARRPRIAPHNGTVLAFLAQHIAQVVAPEMAGPDRHAFAAEAYIGARDFNAEILPQGAGFNIQV